VRRRYTNLKGEQKEKKRIAFSATQAVRLKRAIDREIERELAGEVPQIGRPRNFSDLVIFCQGRELAPAEYSGETKIAGRRSWRSAQSYLKPLQSYFGQMSLGAITYDDCLDYKRRRLNTDTERGGRRSIASVDREMALLRMLLFVALRERMGITEHPFHRGAPLIQNADEVERMRILTFDEEERLLAVCTGMRAHLRLQIIFAIETAMRQNEQLTLRLSDIDDRIITLRAYNSKTSRARVIPIFERLARELQIELGSPARRGRLAPEDLLFQTGKPRQAFARACELAGIEGLRWHDLRHTAITRMLHTYGLQSAEVMKISGHTNLKTFLRYVNLDREVARSIAARVDAVRAVPPPVSSIIPAAEAPEIFDAGDVTEVPQ